MKKLICMFLILCIVLTGCGGGVFQKREKINDKLDSIRADDDNQIITGSDFTTSTGRFFKNNQGLVYYLDFDSMQSMVVCSKPDCRHFGLQDDINSTCSAILPDCQYMFLYQDNLYYMNPSKDNRLQMELYKAEKDLSKREKVASFDFKSINSLILSNGKLYIPAQKPVESETEEQVNSHNNIIGIHCIDLETFKDEKVYAEQQGKFGGYEPVGIYQNQCLYSYGIFDENDEVSDAKLCNLNLDSGESKTLFTGKMYAKLLDDKYFYYSLLDDNILRSYNLDSGEDQIIVDFSNNEEEKIVNVKILDHKLFFITRVENPTGIPITHLYYYDPETKQTTQSQFIESFTNTSDDALVYYEYKDKFILYINGLNLAYITKEDFYAGKTNYKEFVVS